MSSKIQAISSFLTERKERLKPEEANELNLKRIEKIDFTSTCEFICNILLKYCSKRKYNGKNQ
mgnify:CR=1 FL=1